MPTKFREKAGPGTTPSHDPPFCAPFFAFPAPSWVDLYGSPRNWTQDRLFSICSRILVLVTASQSSMRDSSTGRPTDCYGPALIAGIPDPDRLIPVDGHSPPI